MRICLLPTPRRLLATLIPVTLLLLLVLSSTAFAQTNAGSGVYKQTNLTSDISGMALHTDPHLVNPWGISFSSASPFWISDNNSGFSTLYDGQGKPNSLVVTIPPAQGGTIGTPTGTVFSSFSNAFVVKAHGKSGASLFLFDSEDGSLSGWSPTVDPTHAIIAVDNSASQAVYKGLAIATVNSKPFLYAANFRLARIDVFDKNFAPFNIQSIGGKLYVTYAKQDKAKHDDVPGPGRGFLDVFNNSGNFIKRLVSHGPLDAPWGMAMAPANFGTFSNDLLVGNFGNGWINAFNPQTGAFLGSLKGTNHYAIVIDGLWALAFGNGGGAGNTNQLFFTAGIQQEQHGLFGVLEAA